jgi:hypothetical protein
VGHGASDPKCCGSTIADFFCSINGKMSPTRQAAPPDSELTNHAVISKVIDNVQHSKRASPRNDDESPKG